MILVISAQCVVRHVEKTRTRLIDEIKLGSELHLQKIKSSIKYNFSIQYGHIMEISILALQNL